MPPKLYASLTYFEDKGKSARDNIDLDIDMKGKPSYLYLHNSRESDKHKRNQYCQAF